MFTGIIQTVGKIAQIEKTGVDARFYINTGALPLADVNIGDSIAVNGVCLTAVTLMPDGFWADVSGETLSRTTLGNLHTGSPVNLEKALTPQTPLGGHIVAGHVDGVGTVSQCYNDGRSLRIHIQAPAELAKYIAEKGSICLDGISLTVNRVIGAEFTVNIVPHTAQMTTWKYLQVGQAVNLEVDVIARYLERLMLGQKAADPEASGISENFLREHGFMS
ncbi:riboflavin synthase, alpha subunit [Beggiatoa alba B18LD]|uniref:Riboflavin synthase n=1 Tax=Beggiatoa alba B18LD TaxID=395493 RepID=I3CDD6_9GAMM|nr:riboflavin synthase [Beggiatoa alba]EIJ41629.1 riboflavin synthase, alpha subunit [Beggiatoa alba B18LD]